MTCIALIVVNVITPMSQDSIDLPGLGKVLILLWIEVCILITQITETLTMINFFKKHGALILILLMFPVMWPVYAMYELARSTSVKYNDCLEAWNLWICGTVTYCIVCAMLWCIYQVVLIIHSDGYLIPSLEVLGVALLLIVGHISAPKIIYYIFKKQKED